LTTDRGDPGLREIIQNGPLKGQQRAYLVLSEEERAKGFVMPVYRSYRHMKCGTDTTMGQALCETYARNPYFYSGTFCAYCGTHFDLIIPGEGYHQFYWVEPDGSRIIPVGAGPEEAALLWEARRKADDEAAAKKLAERNAIILAEAKAAWLKWAETRERETTYRRDRDGLHELLFCAGFVTAKGL
jgi:hypothetical protein